MENKVTRKMHAYLHSPASETLDKTKEPADCSEPVGSDLRLLDVLINKILKKLEQDSCEPKIGDALKAIQLKQKVAPASEAEKIFWQEIEDIRTSELERLYSQDPPESLEAQILRCIMELKDQVKSGALPVRTITDAFNQGKSKESQLTYSRIGRLLSAMGFSKGRRERGASVIIWDEKILEWLERKYHQDAAELST